METHEDCAHFFFMGCNIKKVWRLLMQMYPRAYHLWKVSKPQGQEGLKR